MNSVPNKAKEIEEVSYTVETRQFIIHRFFGDKKTVKDLFVAEISQGILQNVPLNTSSEADILKQ